MIYEPALLYELEKEIDKNIYCFGAGKAFDSFINEFEDDKFENRVKGIVDNNLEVAEKSFKVIKDSCVPIISLDHMLNDIKSNDYILITTILFDEIIEQLEKIKKLDKIRFGISYFMRMERRDNNRIKNVIPTVLSTYKELRIPKTIHYCWFGEKEIPKQQKKWMKSWKDYCPEYEIVEWNESNYDVHKTKYISQAYEMKKWAFVSDYARIDIINNYGGVYLDTDVELIKNIDLMLMNDAFCGFELSQYVAYGLGFGSRKNNPILEDIKGYYDNNSFILDNGNLNQTACPIVQTEVMKKYGLKCNGEFQIVNGMAVYPSRVLCGMSPISFRVEKDPLYTYAIHHYEGSWVVDKQEKEMMIKRMKKWGCNKKFVYTDL
ncbi:MAG: hypothetical protein HFG53_08810 [Lachnospiraceae bacterium]|jgi:hypothetical protein|nr:hypothetical protein [Lachnospiraceae bacterium]